MEGCTEEIVFANHNGFAVITVNDIHAWPDFIDPGGPYKDKWKVGFVSCGFKAVQLASPCITSHRDVEPAIAGLRWLAHVSGAQNQACTGREHGFSTVYETSEWFSEFPSFDQFVLCCTFTAGKTEAIEIDEIIDCAYMDNCVSECFQMCGMRRKTALERENAYA